MSSFTYYSSIPQSTDVIANSQGQILTNFTSIGSWTAVDHYSFGTGKDGFHTHVTNPNQGTHPATTSNPLIYGMQDSGPVGVIQYSRGPSNAVPTPLTALQSPSVGFTLTTTQTSDVLDFTGLARAFCELFVMGELTGLQVMYSLVFWDGTTLLNVEQLSSNIIQTLVSGRKLQVKNIAVLNLTNIFWTLKMHRLQ